jgi:hypothetical protein
VSSFLELNGVGNKRLIRTANRAKQLTFTENYAHFSSITGGALPQEPDVPKLQLLIRTSDGGQASPFERIGSQFHKEASRRTMKELADF